MIKVMSRKGLGTRSDIYLPSSDKKVVMEEALHAELLEGEETILLVDDEEVNIEVTKEILEMLGYQVLAAGSGMEALKIYREHGETIDLVILDMIMPDMSGGVVFDKLREMNSKVRVILSTGYSLKGQASDIMSRGCRAFIQKPFRIEELSQKVRQVLDE